MQEQGLSGAAAAKGPAPTLTMPRGSYFGYDDDWYYGYNGYISMYKDIRVNIQVQLGLPFFSWSTCLYSEVILSSYLRFFSKEWKDTERPIPNIPATYLLHRQNRYHLVTLAKRGSGWSPHWPISACSWTWGSNVAACGCGSLSVAMGCWHVAWMPLPPLLFFLFVLNVRIDHDDIMWHST